MIKEAASIADRNFANFLLYQVMVDVLATNGSSTVLNVQSSEFIVSYVD
jgi:hypothetical protein